MKTLSIIVLSIGILTAPFLTPVHAHCGVCEADRTKKEAKKEAKECTKKSADESMECAGGVCPWGARKSKVNTKQALTSISNRGVECPLGKKEMSKCEKAPECPIAKKAKKSSKKAVKATKTSQSKKTEDSAEETAVIYSSKGGDVRSTSVSTR